jgi:hypothetical protein
MVDAIAEPKKEAFFLVLRPISVLDLRFKTNPNVRFSLANRYSWLNFELFTSSFGSLAYILSETFLLLVFFGI